MTDHVPLAGVPLRPAARARLDELSHATGIPVADLVDLIVLGLDEAAARAIVERERARPAAREAPSHDGLVVSDPSNSPAGPHVDTPAHPFPE